MKSGDGVVCPSCQREVVPRLWHYGGRTFTYMTTQHMCPYCGVVMYETGGGIHRGCRQALVFFSVVFVALCLLLLLSQLVIKFNR
jgi:hypothetical protein